MLQRFVLSLALLLWLASTSQAAPVITLSATSSGSALNADVELLEDSHGTLSIGDITSATQQSRFQAANGRASVGQSLNPWWIKLSVQRDSSAPTDWVLEVGSV
ncbi:7TM-DISM domain-containing protein, partial [Bowmanella yangjiangensis]